MMRELPPGARLEDTSISARGCGRKGLASWPCVCWRFHKRRVLACRRRWSLARLQLVWPVPVAARVIDGHHAGGWTSTPIVSGGQEAAMNRSVRMVHQLGVCVTAVMWCLNALGAWTSRLPGRPNSPIQNEQRGTNSRRQDRAPFQGWMQADSATETTFFCNGKGRYLDIADMMPEAQHFLSFSSSHFFAHSSLRTLVMLLLVLFQTQIHFNSITNR